MTSYCSLLYMGIFLPCVMLCYAAAPKRVRPGVLLVSSYVFFWAVSGRLLVYLLVTTAVAYGGGLWLDRLQSACTGQCREVPRPERKAIKARFRGRRRRVLALAVAVMLGMLVVLKYSAFAAANLNRVLGVLHVNRSLTVPAFILPIGISFYTLEAVSYLVDVYRETVTADRNPGRVALFLAFFPQIMEGPIGRYGQTAQVLWEGRPITYRNLTFGMQRIAFGVLKKMVIADRLNILIETVFSDFAQYDGGIIAVAMFFYTCQLYMEFSGTMDMVIGTAEIFGVALPENFRRPFLSRTVAKFWTRWHITLGTWFKDYVFYPLSMSKGLTRLTLRARKRLGNHFGPLISASVALFAVWLCNGLWHGAGWSYIFFGMYHFFWILLGNILEPFVRRWAERFRIDRESVPYRAMQILRTVLLVNVGELFFRAESLKVGLAMFHRMITGFTLASFSDGTILSLGMDSLDFLIAFVAILLVLAIHVLAERKISVREELARRNVVIRWAAYYGLILFIVIFGAYGVGYVPVDPIYAGF